MKAIIIVSTLLFVTASFLGIGNYIRYNQTLMQQGLYAEPVSAHKVQPVLEQQSENLIKTNLQTIPSNAVSEQPTAEMQTGTKSKENKHPENRPIRNSTEQKPVLHAAKKPREREINFKEFSRAPLLDEPEPELLAEPHVQEPDNELTISEHKE